MLRIAIRVVWASVLAFGISAEARAGVTDQHFNFNAHAAMEGAYTGAMGFNATTLYVDNDENGPPDTAGPYNALGSSYAGFGSVVTLITAQTVQTDPVYEQLTWAVSIDLKQSNIPVIQVLFAATPASIFGVGVGTGFDPFVFTGTEDIQQTTARPSRKK